MDEELVKLLEARAADGPDALCGMAAREIRRLDVVVREGQRQAHDETYGRRSTGMAVQTS